MSRENKHKSDTHRTRKKEKRIRLDENLLWGVHPVFEALTQNPQRIVEIFLQKERHGKKREHLITLARKAGIALNFVDALKIDGDDRNEIRHQGIVARISETELLDFHEFQEKLAKKILAGEPCRIVALDSLQDPHNVGAIIRSVPASGASGVLLTRRRSAPLGGTVAKSSAGAMAHIDICRVTNLVTALAALKKIGFWIFGTVKEENAQSIYDTDFTVPSCVVIGAEGTGIRPLVKKECDRLLSIPMHGTLDSLNCSVAAAVVLFEMMRQNLTKQT